MGPPGWANLTNQFVEQFVRTGVEGRTNKETHRPKHRCFYKLLCLVLPGCLALDSLQMLYSGRSPTDGPFYPLVLGQGAVWCGGTVAWCGVVWCGVGWCGVLWFGVVWCGVVWRGVVRYGTL